MNTILEENKFLKGTPAKDGVCMCLCFDRGLVWVTQGDVTTWGPGRGSILGACEKRFTGRYLDFNLSDFRQMDHDRKPEMRK